MSPTSGGPLRVNERKIPCAMTIAGSDSGGGAGVQADLKTFSALGVFGTCAVTAVTAQNTRGVHEIFPLPPELVKRQIEVVLNDVRIEAAKTGMLYSKEIMGVTSESIDKYRLKAVVDPVLRAGTGDPLIYEGDNEALVRLMAPRAYVLTPNVPEAEAVTDIPMESLEDMKEAAQKIAELGAKAVVIKGGHLELEKEKIYDVLYHGGALRVFEKPRVKIELHGGGCTFSAAITAHLARGADIDEAVEKAEEFMETSIRYSLKVGAGRTPVNQMAHLYNESEMFHVLDNVEKAAGMIEARTELLPFIADVGTQVAMAIPYPKDEKDVAAVEGRIIKFRERPRAVGSSRFGASRHIARIILAVMKYDPEMRAALNLHCDLKLVSAFKKAGFKVSSFDRSLEPADVKSVEGKSLSWGTEEAIRSLGEVPDAIYDEGEVGREPMIRVLGRTATEAVNRALTSVRHYSSFSQK